MNKVEAWKREKHGFDVWTDVERYAATGTVMADISEADLERMKWHGIFYRKRVEDGRYMIRVRIPGCDLTSAQARTLAEIARVGYSIIDVTTRGNVQIQGFEISDLPGVLASLEASGLTAKQTGHDNVRNVMTHPWAGIDPNELIDVRQLCKNLTDVFMGDRELSNLPRKFNVAVDGRPVPAPHCWTQDTSFVAARRPCGSVAFHWLLAGTQGQNPRLAWKPPLWVREDQACDVLRHSLHVFHEHGSREKRDKARLRYLIERIGLDEFLAKVQTRMGYALDECHATIPEVHENEDFVGWFRQKQAGLWALGVNIPLGRLTHEQLDGLANLADTYGDGTLRAAYDQGAVLPGIPAARKNAAARALNRLGLEHEADTVSRNIMACTGRQFCNIAVSETKGHAFTLMDRLRDRGTTLGGIKINMSGCPSSCAQTYTGDIGLKGVRVRRKGGTKDGFDIFVGGGAHGLVELGLPYRKGVDVDQLPEVIGHLIDEYQSEGNSDQTFSQYWRTRIAAGHSVDSVAESEFRPDAWICDSCSHEHFGEDPPIFCPKCSAIRKHFARIDQDEVATTQEIATETRPDGYRDLGSLADLQRDGRMSTRWDDHELAIFQVDDEIRCLDGLCPHEGGPMSQGDVVNGIVTCPWHGWAFSCASGKSTDGNGCTLKSYPVKVEEGRLLVKRGASERVEPKPVELQFTLKVLEVIEETHDTRTIRLDNTEGILPIHQAGQHLKVGIETPGGLIWRSFTVSSPPTRPSVVDLTIKRNPNGIVSNAVHDLKLGDTVTVAGPRGQFLFDPVSHREPLVLAVAGSGVTPAMAILRTIHDMQLDIPVTLLYGSRTRQDVIFAKELDAFRVRIGGLRLVHTLSRPDDEWTGEVGRVTPELLARHIPEPSKARYFLCGPGNLRDGISSWLAGQGVPTDRVHSEMFGKART